MIAQSSSTEAIYTLARTLAGTTVQPVCTVERDSYDSTVLYDGCVWTFNSSTKPESLTVGRDENNVALLAWDHVVGDDDGIRLFLDRLMPFISSHNLTMHKCEDGFTPAGCVESTLWSSATYWALFSRIRNDTLPTRVVFTLTDDTGNLRGKKVLCKETGSLGPQAPSWYNLAKIPSSRESSSSWLPVSTTRP